jgi:predicted MPP superfamily phosphohydrolase
VRKIKSFVIIQVLFLALCFGYLYGEPQKIADEPGKEAAVLLFSDIHFDPFADGAAKELEKTDISGWSTVLESKKDGKFPEYGRDTNYSLLSSAIGEISRVSAGARCAIIGGDMICHNFEAKYSLSGCDAGLCPLFALKTIEFVSLMLKRAMPGIPVYYVTGNNDSDSGDYNIIPGGAMLGALSSVYDTVSTDKTASRDFKKGGYYELPFPVDDKSELIVLNDIFWHKKHKRADDARDAPGAAEMKWFAGELDAAAKNGKSVFVAMHIPPGIDAYLASKDRNCHGPDGFLDPVYNREFIGLIYGHREVVKSIFAGHTHFDDFRVFSDAGKPFATVSIIPSISPVHGNNPAFETALLESNGEIGDRTVYNLPGFGGKDAETNAKWALEYTFCGAYGCHDLSPANLYGVAESIVKNPDMFEKYITFYTAGNTLLSSIIKQQSRIYECAMTSGGFDEYAGCACSFK